MLLTTDFRDIRDINHERKRANPFNLCYLCSKKIGCIRCIWFSLITPLLRQLQINHINPFPFSFAKKLFRFLRAFRVQNLLRVLAFSRSIKNWNGCICCIWLFICDNKRIKPSEIAGLFFTLLYFLFGWCGCCCCRGCLGGREKLRIILRLKRSSARMNLRTFVAGITLMNCLWYCNWSFFIDNSRSSYARMTASAALLSLYAALSNTFFFI